MTTRLFAFPLLLLLCACSDQSLTRQDKNFLEAFKKELAQEEDDPNNILYALIKNEPEQLAKDAAQKADYRLISSALGYHAREEDATLFGVKCDRHVETRNVVFGCVPPPPVVYKLMKRYNETLIGQPDFPGKDDCTADGSGEALIQLLESSFNDEAKRKLEREIINWKYRTKKSRLYNN